MPSKYLVWLDIVDGKPSACIDNPNRIMQSTKHEKYSMDMQCAP